MIISPAKAAEAAGVLAVTLEGLTADAVRCAYRSKAKDCHPDHHSDKAEEWARLSWATHVLSHWVTMRPTQVESQQSGVKCRNCGGSGRVQAGRANRFGVVLTMQCTSCRGLGEIFPEEHDGD